jgi:putative SOS response-associated peptidase YedK
MCGRFAQTIPVRDIVREYGIDDVLASAGPGYNISPGQRVLAVIAADSGVSLVDFTWGLVPFWARDPSPGRRLINARAETVDQKPAFRHAFRTRRCLVVASGFFEWKRRGRAREPYFFRPARGQTLALAGLFDRWVAPDAGELHTCVILTVEANELVRDIHDRMPLIIPPEARMRWIDPSSPPEILRGLMMPCDPASLEAYPVSTVVNSPASDGPQCIAPLASDDADR